MKHSAPDEPPAEIEPKVKKSGTKFEISFKPTDVGTHKVNRSPLPIILELVAWLELFNKLNIKIFQCVQ